MDARYFRFNSRFGAQPQRAPLLEKLLARADAESLRDDWRSDAYAVMDSGKPMPTLAAAIYANACSSVDQPRWECPWRCLATPLSYLAEMSNVRLAIDGLLQLQQEEAFALAGDFARLWQDSPFRLEAVGPLLFCASARSLQATLCDPERAVGRSIHEFLPTGPDAPALKRLMSEMEMWLFEHPLNAARHERGVQPISALWPWGGGTPLSSLPTTASGAAGSDVFFSAFRAEKGSPENVMVAPEAPGTDAWNAAPLRWLRGALEDLRRGLTSRVFLSAGARRFEITQRWRHRIFRKLKPWWEYFD